MKPMSYKRIFAYLIDTLIVTFVASILTMAIPASSEYTKATEELTTVMEDYSKGEITDSEYLEKANDISYTINKESVSVSIVTVVLTTIYFVVVAYYMNGQTLGKKLMKLKIVAEDNKLTMNKLLVRSLIIDSILMNMIGIVTILLLNKTLYLKTYDITTTIFGAIYIVTFAMILFKEDGRGLHDMIAKTKVVTIDNQELNEIQVVKEEVEEEKIVEIKKEKDAEVKKEKITRITRTSKKK